MTIRSKAASRRREQPVTNFTNMRSTSSRKVRRTPLDLNKFPRKIIFLKCFSTWIYAVHMKDIFPD